MPAISVVMTFFNESEEQLKRSIGSILNQTFTDIELIVIPGNPENTDGIVFLKNIKDPRVKIFEVHEKTRMTNCLNIAIRSSKGTYIALQEADDESILNRLQVQHNFLSQNENVDIVGTSITYIDDYSKKVLAIREYPEDPTLTFQRYAAIAHPTILVKKEIFEKHGYYLETDEYRNCPDYELWLRWLSKGVVFRNITQNLFNYFQTNYNGRNKNAIKTLKSVIKLKSGYRKALHFTIYDEIYLILEKVIAFLPQAIVSKLFYVWVKIK